MNVEKSALLKSVWFHLVMILFWTSLYYGSLDFLGSPDMMYWPMMSSLFSARLPIQGGFFIFEWSLIILCFYILKISKNYFKEQLSSYFLLIGFIILFILLNPNNTSNILELFLARDSRFVMLIPLVYFAFIFREDDFLVDFLRRFIQIGFIVTVIHCILSLIYWGLNDSPLFFNRYVTIPHTDNLLFIGLFGTIALIRYLYCGKTNYILIFSLLTLTSLLSLRRTAFIITLLVSFLLVFLALRNVAYTKRAILLVGIVGILFNISLLFSGDKLDLVDLFGRQISFLTFFDSSFQNNEIKDSGHLNQSTELTESMIENVFVWGSGIQKREVYLFGQSTRAHSNIAYGYAKYGILVPIFYLVSFLYFLISFIFQMNRTFISKNPTAIAVNSVNLTIQFLLVLFFVSGWSSGIGIFDNFPQIYFYFFFLLSLSGLSKDKLVNVLAPEVKIYGTK